MRPRNVFFKKSITNIRKNIYKQEKKNNYFKNYPQIESTDILNVTPANC